MENVIILGSGCAGLTAALYTSRASLKPLVLEGTMPGGLLTTTTEVENFPGFPDGVDGFELTDRIRKQAEKFGARYEIEKIVKIENLGPTHKRLTGETGKIYETKVLIVATGSTPRMLGIKGEKEYYTKGVHTCATCDGAFYRGKDIVVIGGGDSACEEAHFLTHFASSVTMIHRRDELRASKVMADRVLNEPKIKIIWNSTVDAIVGNSTVHGIVLKDTQTGEVTEHKTDGVFLAIGHTPQTEFLRGVLELNEEGYIKPLSPSMVRTSVDGIYTAGDCSDSVYRQAITAAGMGAMAAIESERFLGVSSGA